MKKTISMILILVLIAVTLVGCGGAKYEDGVWEGEGQGMSTIKVAVTVEEGKIAKVEVLDHDETEGFSEEALEDIPEAIVNKNSTDVDGISGATMTSDGIKEAVNNALEGAK